MQELFEGGGYRKYTFFRFQLVMPKYYRRYIRMPVVEAYIISAAVLPEGDEPVRELVFAPDREG
ncbi:MAG TPA: hypothetical protein VJ842_18925 [Pyrinomonadaceae bacterium]|nr:hypothetical protein [Pyrinomonadaceae bacterium]